MLRKIKQGRGRSERVGDWGLSRVITEGAMEKDLKEERSHLDI